MQLYTMGAPATPLNPHTPRKLSIPDLRLVTALAGGLGWHRDVRSTHMDRLAGAISQGDNVIVIGHTGSGHGLNGHQRRGENFKRHFWHGG